MGLSLLVIYFFNLNISMQPICNSIKFRRLSYRLDWIIIVGRWPVNKWPLGPEGLSEQRDYNVFWTTIKTQRKVYLCTTDPRRAVERVQGGHFGRQLSVVVSRTPAGNRLSVNGCSGSKSENGRFQRQQVVRTIRVPAWNCSCNGSPNVKLRSLHDEDIWCQ